MKEIQATMARHTEVHTTYSGMVETFKSEKSVEFSTDFSKKFLEVFVLL